LITRYMSFHRDEMTYTAKKYGRMLSSKGCSVRKGASKMINRKIQSSFGEIEIQGICEQAFAEVEEQFERNFRERDECGGSVCVTHDGRTVVDLWGGLADSETKTPWARDTISIIWSSTKGATALCLHLLVSRGLVDINAPVVKYWPEFGSKGKEKITVKMLLTHQCGLLHFRNQVPEGAFADWTKMIRLLEEEEPMHKPGERSGYHAYTFGWLVGEIVHRVSGKSLGTFFRDEVAKPLGLDFWIGLPEEHDKRTATMIPPPMPGPDDPIGDYVRAMLSDPQSIQAILAANTGGWQENFNARMYRAAEVPAANAYTNARGLAGMYAPLACGGKLGNVELVNKDALAGMGAVCSASEVDALLLHPMRFSLGFMKAIDNRHKEPGNQETNLMSEEAFGHPGYGGSIGLADPGAMMSFGYTMNKMGPGTAINIRAQSLLDATYRSLGYTSNSSGRWIK
jgi:CubicO group peptidase (beta-lactamase class C family)